MAQQIDPPVDPYVAYVPSEQDPWDLRKVNHLYRRFAFGPKRDWMDASLADGNAAPAIERLFDFDPNVDPFADLYEQTRGLFPFDNHGRSQEWWCFRIVKTDRPLQERIALLWHGHFATGGGKVYPPERCNVQIDLFRKMGLGSFRDLLLAVGRDPAMLLWLDGNNSKKKGPNENYAREVMELFALGVGNYTENDVQQLARCFTGWRIDGLTSNLNKSEFDDGEKEVFGQKGTFNDEQAVDLLIAHPACAKYISKNLLTEFVHPDPTDDHVAHYANRLRETSFNIGQVLKEIAASRLFFSSWAYRSKIKSPVDLVMGGIYAIGRGANAAFLREHLNRMGQNLLFPPTVKGWDGEKSWINSNTVVYRFNFGLQLVRQQDNEFFGSQKLFDYIKSKNLTPAEAILDHFAAILLDNNITTEAKSKLIDYMGRNQKNEPGAFEFNANSVKNKVKGVIHLMTTSPEYQLL